VTNYWQKTSKIHVIRTKAGHAFARAVKAFAANHWHDPALTWKREKGKN
jgi:hypothetical protein